MTDENLVIPLPILKPVRIPTKNLSFFKRFLKSFEARKWELVEDYIFYIPWLNEKVLVPKGFIFDGASVPRALWFFVDPTGILLIGSIFHDFGYKYNALLNDKFEVICKDAGQAFFDEQIKEVSSYVNNTHFMEDVSWAALRGFGFLAWNEHREANCSVYEDYKDRGVHNKL